MGAFRFRQFEVVQDYAAMKVNTDAVLLGAWMELPDGETRNVLPCGSSPRLLDIGTGTGVIALMAAQRLAAAKIKGRVEAVEIDEGACTDASVNFAAAPWKDIEMCLHRIPLQQLPEPDTAKYNLIFTNPPYFIHSLKNTSDTKTLARHTNSLSQSEILYHCARLIAYGGLLALVLPVVEGEEFLRKVEYLKGHTPQEESCFHVRRICKVYTVERKPAKRMLIELEYCNALDAPLPRLEHLVMLSNGLFTPQYAALVKDFYL